MPCRTFSCCIDDAPTPVRCCGHLIWAEQRGRALSSDARGILAPGRRYIRIVRLFHHFHRRLGHHDDHGDLINRS